MRNHGGHNIFLWIDIISKNQIKKTDYIFLIVKYLIVIQFISFEIQ